LNSQDSGTVTYVPLSDLLATNSRMLQDGLGQTQLTQIGRQSFPQISKDQSLFESSYCGKSDVVIPPDCSVKANNIAAKKVALIGDSKMSQFVQPITEYFKLRGWSIYPFISIGCTIYAPVNNQVFTNCTKRSDWIKNQIQNNSFDLVISGTYPTGPKIKSSASDYLDEIIKASKQTILLTQFPRIENPVSCIKANFSYPTACSEIQKYQIDSLIADKKFLYSKSSPKVNVIDTIPWACIQDKCPIVVGDIFLTRDGSHMTATFIKKITPIINATLDSISNW